MSPTSSPMRRPSSPSAPFLPKPCPAKHHHAPSASGTCPMHLCTIATAVAVLSAITLIAYISQTHRRDTTIRPESAIDLQTFTGPSTSNQPLDQFLPVDQLSVDTRPDVDPETHLPLEQPLTQNDAGDHHLTASNDDQPNTQQRDPSHTIPEIQPREHAQTTADHTATHDATAQLTFVDAAHAQSQKATARSESDIDGPLQECGGLWSMDERLRRLGNDTELQLLTTDVNEMSYFPTIDLLLHVVPKGGSTAQLLWIYRGLTGQSDLVEWDSEACETFIQNYSSPCWKGMVFHIHDLPVAKRREVLSRESTLRVAVQREPYSRVVSAFKSKFTCERERFFGDIDMVVDVALLREQGGDHSGNDKCMSLEEYATILDNVRSHVGEAGYVYRFAYIDAHIRPAVFFFEQVEYDLILDVNEIRKARSVREIYERLPYKSKIEEAVPMVHTSGSSVLTVPEGARKKLQAYAGLTRVEPIRLCGKTSKAMPLDWKV